MPARNLLELIGNTPMLEITRFDTGSCRLFVKLENQPARSRTASACR
jgi:cystathionine beta-synthase